MRRRSSQECQVEAEEAEESQKMYGLMRAKETKEVEKDLVSRETQPGLASLSVWREK